MLSQNLPVTVYPYDCSMECFQRDKAVMVGRTDTMTFLSFIQCVQTSALGLGERKPFHSLNVCPSIQLKSSFLVQKMSSEQRKPSSMDKSGCSVDYKVKNIFSPLALELKKSSLFKPPNHNTLRATELQFLCIKNPRSLSFLSLPITRNLQNPNFLFSRIFPAKTQQWSLSRVRQSDE